jgi:hypothetical protein
MTIRKIGFLALAAILAGCASTNPQASNQTTPVQSAVYVVSDATAPLKADAEPASTVPGASKLMRIYWFLGGR